MACYSYVLQSSTVRHTKLHLTMDEVITIWQGHVEVNLKAVSGPFPRY